MTAIFKSMHTQVNATKTEQRLLDDRRPRVLLLGCIN